MSIFRKLFYIMMIIAFIMGCASGGKEQMKPAVPPSGTIHLDEWQFMALISGDFGHGTLDSERRGPSPDAGDRCSGILRTRDPLGSPSA